MTDRIGPALTLEQWQEVADYLAMHPHHDAAPFLDTIGLYTPESAIAALNAALPDSDPRKITRKWVDEIRAAVNTEYFGVGPLPDGFPPSLLARIADALESYLPPEEP